MPKKWETPFYKVITEEKGIIDIDVTDSVSAGLSANGLIYTAIEYFRKHEIKTVLDFGAGALRHSFPLLEAGFDVCAVEFSEQYNKPKCSAALKKAREYQNFSTLVYPKDFLKSKLSFDGVLLCYVINIMPLPEERLEVIGHIYKKLKNDGLLLYMAQWGQITDKDLPNKVNDGYFRGPNKNHFKTFYSELNVSSTESLFRKKKFKRIESFSIKGEAQVLMFKKEKKSWA